MLFLDLDLCAWIRFLGLLVLNLLFFVLVLILSLGLLVLKRFLGLQVLDLCALIHVYFFVLLDDRTLRFLEGFETILRLDFFKYFGAGGFLG